MKYMTIFVIILTAIMYSSGSSNDTKEIALFVGLAIFLFYLAENYKWSRFYITDIIRTTNDKIKIIYYDRDVKKEFTADVKQLSFDKRFVWYKVRSRAPYLVIKKTGDGVNIEQHDVGDWDEKTMDRINSIRL
jgi:hypothetical protein